MTLQVACKVVVVVIPAEHIRDPRVFFPELDWTLDAIAIVDMCCLLREEGEKGVDGEACTSCTSKSNPPWPSELVRLGWMIPRIGPSRTPLIASRSRVQVKCGEGGRRVGRRPPRSNRSLLSWLGLRVMIRKCSAQARRGWRWPHNLLSRNNIRKSGNAVT